MIHSLPTVRASFNYDSVASTDENQIGANASDTLQFNIRRALLLSPSSAVIMPYLAMETYGVNVIFPQSINGIESFDLQAFSGHQDPFIESSPGTRRFLPSVNLSLHSGHIDVVSDDPHGR